MYLAAQSGVPPAIPFKLLEKWTSGFTLNIGFGSFGEVFEGSIDKRGKIAVKKLKATHKDKRAMLDSLRREVCRDEKLCIGMCGSLIGFIYS
jgi:hypothetical protein